MYSLNIKNQGCYNCGCRPQTLYKVVIGETIYQERQYDGRFQEQHTDYVCEECFKKMNKE